MSRCEFQDPRLGKGIAASTSHILNAMDEGQVSLASLSSPLSLTRREKGRLWYLGAILDGLVAAGLNFRATLRCWPVGTMSALLILTTGPGCVIWSLSSELSSCILGWGQFLCTPKNIPEDLRVEKPNFKFQLSDFLEGGLKEPSMSLVLGFYHL